MPKRKLKKRIKSKGHLRIATLIVLLLISVLSYLFFKTPLFHDKVSLEPMKIYYSVSEGILINSHISKQKYPIDCVRFSISEPFKSSKSKCKIKFENFTEEIDLWYDLGGGEEAFNFSKAEEYMRNHLPDFLIEASFIKDGFAKVWSQVWQSQPVMVVYTEPILKQTSFGVWEGQYFFHTKFTGGHLNEETYLSADVKKVIFEIEISDDYQIANAEDFKLDKISGGYLLTRELEGGETFHLVIEEVGKERIKEIIGFVSPALFGGVIGYIIGLVLGRPIEKTKIERKTQEPDRRDVKRI